MLKSNRSPVADVLILFAVDIEDVAVLSAHLEGAQLVVGQMAYLPKQRRFAFVAERKREGSGAMQTVGVHFEGVARVEHKNVAQDHPDMLLNLLAITFDPLDSPAGHIVLHCAQGRVIRLEVDYIEAALSDLADGKGEEA